jgi:hypothetical protein
MAGGLRRGLSRIRALGSACPISFGIF